MCARYWEGKGVTFTCEWTGEAVSSNRRLIPGGARRKWRLNPRYAVFEKALTFTLVTARIRQRWQITSKAVDVLLEVELPTLMDPEAVQKACLDALQLAGVVVNDRQCRAKAVPVGKAAGRVSRIRFLVEEQ
jgi:hypothetical protein